MLRSLFFLVCLHISWAYAQNTKLPGNTLAGKLIIKWKQGHSFAEISEKLPAGLEIKLMDAAFRLAEIKVLSGNDALAKSRLQAQPWCTYVQQQHTLQRRRLPGDPQISSQSHLPLIRAEYAWNYSVGTGVGKLGDTIVVAVMDDGMDTTHPDLTQNMWANHGEISWNGIDDDGNGYTDDHFGWNGGDSNGRVVSAFGGSHGTPVAGIIGARGDNNLGVSGINWIIKLLPVVVYGQTGAGDEGGMFRSFLYILRNKQLYDKSLGSKGINIMAVNLSVGIDGAFPVDAPVWCEMIDSLGAAGIITCGASTNQDLDVEIAGDIPSTCPGASLIVVANTDGQDQPVHSGKSKKFIDLSAPGEASYTTNPSQPAGNGKYGSFSGTSAAAPMVTGTVAYLYNTACLSYWNLYAANKDSALKLMKRWILQGTDTLSSLAGRSVTDGRLNMHKSLLAMYQWCGQWEPTFSVEDPEFRGLRVYPNPVLSGSSLKLSRELNFHGSVRIMDMSGRLLRESAQNGPLEEIEVGPLKPGTYLVQIIKSGAQKTLIFQVQ